MKPQTEQAYIKKAEQLIQQNQLNQAETVLIEAVQAYPHSINLVTQLAEFYQSTNRPNKAAQWLEAYCQTAKPIPELIQALIQIYETHQEYDRAIFWYQELIQQNVPTESIEANIKRLQKKYLITQWKKTIKKSIPKCFKHWLQALAIGLLRLVEPKSQALTLHQYLKFAKRYDPTFQKDGIAYHKARELWLAQTNFPIHTGGLKVLDLGTGKNSSPLYWSTFNNHVVALDGSAYGFSALSTITKQLGETSFNLTVGDMRELPFLDNQFNAVTALCAIEHIPENGDTQTMHEIYRVTKPGGTVIVTVEASVNHVDQWMEVPYEIGYQVNETHKTASQWESVFCRNYTLETMRQRLLHNIPWQTIAMGFYDDVSLQVRRFFAPEHPSIVASLLRSFQPILTFLYYKHTHKPKTPSAIGYLILRKP